MIISLLYIFFFFFNDTATTEIYTLSLHDALPISCSVWSRNSRAKPSRIGKCLSQKSLWRGSADGSIEQLNGVHNRSEEHTSELQSLAYLVCRLLLEKKKKKKI